MTYLSYLNFVRSAHLGLLSPELSANGWTIGPLSFDDNGYDCDVNLLRGVMEYIRLEYRRAEDIDQYLVRVAHNRPDKALTTLQLPGRFGPAALDQVNWAHNQIVEWVRNDPFVPRAEPGSKEAYRQTLETTPKRGTR